MTWILIVILIVGIVTIRLVMRHTEPAVHCPQCDNDNVTIVRKEPINTHITHRHTGLQGTTDIQVQYRMDYRCNTCHKHWTSEMTESN